MAAGRHRVAAIRHRMVAGGHGAGRRGVAPTVGQALGHRQDTQHQGMHNDPRSEDA